ncbi:hypothetical protein B0J13DRAFT_627007 [Dactylonectria estremocensis]|uniref:Amino acid permease/ SLC12A domain-containing protein n=1 Tax=Dactylonectria estremocensis TaxID=1079267 RepID=A0A9P9E344_9HYPO|nr:hypothetical protein B0J13DRAFT_627007 [Dactylonectria estremocensis]
MAISIHDQLLTAIGGSTLVAIFNGGPPGVLYEFIVVSAFYWTMAASIAELASAIPSLASSFVHGGTLVEFGTFSQFVV